MKKLNRWHQILSNLANLEFATIEQLRAVIDMGGYKNAYRILKDMESEGYIQSRRYQSLVFYLTKKGREEAETDKRPQLKMLEHTLMRNDLYIYLNQPLNWQTEYPVKFGTHHLIADAHFKRYDQHHFIEVDRTLTMKQNKQKLDDYAKLEKLFYRHHKSHIKLIYYTTTEHRKKRLRTYAEIPLDVYSVEDLR